MGRRVKARARLEFRYRSAAVAERVLKSVEVDNAPHIASHRQGPTIVSEATADSPMSLLHTLEDFLACVALAERLTRGRR